MPDRGQTEVLGYVLIFAVVVVTVAVVMVSGQAGLEDRRDVQRTANVEEGFEELAENVDDVAQDGAPSRATELSLSGERLQLGAPVTITVSGEYSNGTTAFSHSRSLRPITYHAQNGAGLTYAGGGVIASGTDGGVAMIRQPHLLLSSDRAVVSIVETDLNRRQLRGRAESVDSQSRVLVRTERRERRILSTTDTTAELTIEVTSPRALAWATYLESEIDPDNTNCVLNDDTVTCVAGTSDRTTVVLSRVAVSFD